MQVQFNIISASTPTQAPSQEYFLAIKASASRALAGLVRDQDSAWCLCEYLDSVDSGDLSMDRDLYRRCVSMLGDFLATRRNDQATRKLADKSWAAKTLLEMLDEYEYAPRQLKRAA